MAKVSVGQTSFIAGELGPYLHARTDLEIYSRGAQSIENYFVLPHGGLDFRRGFEFFTEVLAPVTGDGVRIGKFSFNKEQEYLLEFTPLQLRIFRNNTLVRTLTTPYLLEDLFELRWEQRYDTFIICHPRYLPRSLVRQGADDLWSLNTITFTNRPWMRYNFQSQLTPSAATGAITLTLDVEPFWKAGHAASTQIRANSGIAAGTGFPQAASGGTALSSAGTAGNAFDGNTATICSAGTNGWIGYQFAAASTVRIVGIFSASTVTLSLAFETDDNASFSSPDACGEALAVTIPAGTTGWVDVPAPRNATHFRVRAINNSVLDTGEVTFAIGNVLNATTSVNLSATTPTRTWQEWAFSTARGFPRVPAFWQNRLFFLGTVDAPAVLLMSNSGDQFNFDNTATNADNAAVFQAATNRSMIGRDMKAKKNLNLFTTDGEVEFSGGNDAISPTTIQARQQSDLGCADIPVLEVDNELYFVTENLREIRSYDYEITKDRFVSDNKTILAHHLFADGQEPFSTAFLRSYANTQSNFLFVTREDGQMCVLTVDAQRNVLAWSRFVTDGLFRDVTTVNVDDGTGRLRETLYAVVQRRINGVDRVFIERLTEQQIFMDHWYKGTDTTAKTNWSGLNTLPNTPVTIVGDDYVEGTFAVDGSGNLILSQPVNKLEAGIAYRAEARTLDPLPNLGARTRRGRKIRKTRATIDLYQSRQLSVDGIEDTFRDMDDQLLDRTSKPFTGNRQLFLRGIDRDGNITIEANRPRAQTVLAVTTEYVVGD